MYSLRGLKKENMSKSQISTNLCRPFITFLAASVIVSLMMVGCGGGSGGYTAGDSLRPSEEEATVTLHQDLMLIDYDRLSLPQYPKTYDISPGEYVLELIFLDTGETNPDVRISTAQFTTVSLNAQPGHLYYIYPSFPCNDKWQPEMSDFVRPEDLSIYPEDFWTDLETGLSIERIREKYFSVKHP